MTDLTSARVLADSTYLNGRRIVTVEATGPRIILAEFNTHRSLSRNSASSRAIPVEKQIARVLEHPFVPQRFPVNQRGMSATDYHEPNTDGYDAAAQEWLDARDAAVRSAQRLSDLGVHKQVTNRLLEPYMWHTIIATANTSAWYAMFDLRISPHAQPEFNTLATAIRDAIEASQPATLEWWQWHLPLYGPDYGDDDPTRTDEGAAWLYAANISAARCARVSYLTHGGVRDPEQDRALADRLATDRHLSPFEHPAKPSSIPERQANLRGWEQLRYSIETRH